MPPSNQTPVALTTDQMLAATAAAANDLAHRSEDLLRQAQWAPWQRRLGIAGIVAMIIISTLQIVISIDNHSVAAAIKSCTTPMGKCYQRSQREATVITRNILLNQILVDTCVKTNTTYAAVLKCVNRTERFSAHAPTGGNQ